MKVFEESAESLLGSKYILRVDSKIECSSTASPSHSILGQICIKDKKATWNHTDEQGVGVVLKTTDPTLNQTHQDNKKSDIPTTHTAPSPGILPQY